jgi:hypothetical protein
MRREELYLADLIDNTRAVAREVFPDQFQFLTAHPNFCSSSCTPNNRPVT